MLPFVPALLILANTTQLTLTVTSEQRELVVGEPLKVTVTWRSPGGGVVLVEDRDFSMNSLALEIRGESGSTLYQEYSRRWPDMKVPRQLSPGEEVAADLVFVMGFSRAAGQRPHVLFSEPGEYSIRAVYLTDRQRPTEVVSNWLSFTVKAPLGPDKAIWDALQGRPEILKGGWSPEQWSFARQLLQRHPASRYLRFVWFHHFEQAVVSLINDQDPDNGKSFWALGQEGRGRFRRDYSDRMLGEILAISDWGPFAPEALSLAIKFAVHAEKADLSDQLTKDLITRYPNSLIAKRYRAAAE